MDTEISPPIPSQIVIDQERLQQIRKEAEKKALETLAEMRQRYQAIQEASRAGILDREKLKEEKLVEKLDKIGEEAKLSAETIKRDDRIKQERQKTEEKREDEQRKADQQKRDDLRSEAIRAEAREKMRAETERRVKDALKEHMPVNLSQQQAGPGYVPYRH